MHVGGAAPSSDNYPSTSRAAPSVWLIHLALITSQCLFGAGSVVGKLGVSRFNPMIFALIRESSAGVILLAIAVCKEGCKLPLAKDVRILIVCGFFIFINQACFIVGDKLAGSTLASAWQPTQPVFTLMISLFLGWELFTVGKVAGIIISCSGAAFMVLDSTEVASSSSGYAIAGNALLMANCLGSSLYVIIGKVVLGRGYSPLFLTTWSYLFGAVMMLAAALAFSSSCGTQPVEPDLSSS